MKQNDWRTDVQYRSYIDDLLVKDEVQQLQNYVQHHHSDRLTHSLSVSYQSYVWAKKLHLDARAVARAGLLHDMFYYDWRDTKFELGSHAFIHPRVSLRNAEKLTVLSPMEKDIILKHMFGATMELPSYRESYLVDMVDNVAAVQEFFLPKWNAFKAKFANI
ncbi:HD domain-containing protein [Periweissella cryptocerci]|uniref:HD domain-containing protein n=1 Tax=Periweissella cryptocerci TaxID=2506420 RepID=A0A4P6YVT1_9LACO|nr:HD domain-containing protein [Periweissella cryptocerci]QBO36932.1 HD domain-containing protein [Periweissella cryptocerci]